MDASRTIFGNVYHEAVGNRFACIVEFRRRGNAGMGEAQLICVLEVGSGDGDFYTRPKLATHWHCRQKSRCRQANGLRPRGGRRQLQNRQRHQADERQHDESWNLELLMGSKTRAEVQF